MQNLRDQLLKAGLITEEQRQKAEADGRRPPQEKRQKPPPRTESQASEPQKNAKPSKKALMKQPLNRMLDLSDPRLLKIFQAIEEHRVRDSVKGEIAFHFTLRDGRVRKIFVKKSIFEGLESGQLAIVESGEEDKHQIVDAKAVPLIREADPEAVRFFAPTVE